MNLVKYEPLSMTKLFDDFWRDSFWGDRQIDHFHPTTDVEEREKDYLLRVELPGIDKKEVKVSVEDGLLVIEGEKKAEEKKERKGYYRREAYYGSFRRSFRLGDRVEAKGIKAEYKDGILRVTVPKTEREVPHEIDVD